MLFEALDATAEHGTPTVPATCGTSTTTTKTAISTSAEPITAAAVAVTFTLPGTPLIYYGQERGVTEQRGTMRWHDGDDDLTDFHRRLVALPADTLHSACSGCARCPLRRDGDADRVVAYERTDGDETLVVVLHFGDGTAKVSLDTIDEETDLLSGNPVGGDGTVEVGDIVAVPATRER